MGRVQVWVQAKFLQKPGPPSGFFLFLKSYLTL